MIPTSEKSQTHSSYQTLSSVQESEKLWFVVLVLTAEED